jgi:hypothetical protein
VFVGSGASRIAWILCWIQPRELVRKFIHSGGSSKMWVDAYRNIACGMARYGMVFMTPRFIL